MISLSEIQKANPNKLQRFLLGVEIIQKYQPDASMEVEFGCAGFINVGSYETCYALTSESDRLLMISLGWTQGYDGWTFYVPDRT